MGQLDLERQGRRTTDGVYARIAQRLLAMAAAIWHSWATSQPVMRPLIICGNRTDKESLIGCLERTPWLPLRPEQALKRGARGR